MIKILISVFALLFFCTICRGQKSNERKVLKIDVLCLYNLSYQEDSTSDIKKNELFSLLIGKESSIFESRKALVYDSVLIAHENEPFTQESLQSFSQTLSAFPMPKYMYYIYKNTVQKKVIYYDRIGRNHYSYQEPTELLNWHLLPEKKILNGYNCQKAIVDFAGRHFVAWYATEIPISEGPYKFYGLPGLIVQIYDTKRFYTFELRKITNLKNYSFLLPNSVATTTAKKVFLQGQANYASDAINRVAAMGNQLDDATKQAFRTKIKKQNNPLELD